MRPRRIALFICSLIFLSSCSHRLRELCYTSDWYGLGKGDGKRGASIHKFSDYVRSCRKFNIKLDRVSYDRGHQDGLLEYCLPVNAYAEGKKGINYLGGCPIEMEDSFVDAFKRGVLYKTYYKEYVSNGERILRLKDDLKEMKKDDKDRKQLQQVLSQLKNRQKNIRETVAFPAGSDLVIP